jgi:hypothetical protein
MKRAVQERASDQGYCNTMDNPSSMGGCDFRCMPRNGEGVEAVVAQELMEYVR